jgi:hypothetical protein
MQNINITDTQSKEIIEENTPHEAEAALPESADKPRRRRKRT